MNTTLIRVLVPACLALLSACGGGGGGGDGGAAPSTNQPPVAVAALKGEAVLQALTVLDSSGSSDPEGGTLSKSWNYGDGGSGSADSHIYTATGTFHAVLTVTDAMGATATAGVDVTVAKCSAAGTRAAQLSPQKQVVCIQTTLGELVAELFDVESPQTTADFLAYVDAGFYAGTLFAPVTNTRIDAGGFTTGPTAKAATRPAIAPETSNGLRNFQYTLAWADPATAVFFVNLVDNHQFDASATVFGQLVSGTATAEAIGAAATSTQRGVARAPTTEIAIRSVARMK